MEADSHIGSPAFSPRRRATMGFLDKAKDMVAGNKDKVADAVDKGVDMVDEKTDGKYTDKLEKADEMIDGQLDKMGEGEEAAE
jgi:hypothetical protein